LELIFGYDIDLLSLIPALFGVILSLYNYYKMSKPAEIIPTEVVNYGLISSSYDECYKIILPLVFHNEGAKKGIIKKIKIGFKHDEKVKYLQNPVKVRLEELMDDVAQLSDWNKFTEQGYRVLQPTYPITVSADSSVDVTLVAVAPYEKEIIPIDKQSEYIIEVYYGKDKMKKIEFKFFLSNENIPDNRLQWFFPN
jgi:hypothetical protein